MSHHCTINIWIYLVSLELLDCFCLYCTTCPTCTHFVKFPKVDTLSVIIYRIKLSMLNEGDTSISLKVLKITKPPSPIWVTRRGSSIDAFHVRWLSNCVIYLFGCITCTLWNASGQHTKWVSVCFDSVSLTQVNITNKYICAFIVMVFCLM